MDDKLVDCIFYFDAEVSIGIATVVATVIKNDCALMWKGPSPLELINDVWVPFFELEQMTGVLINCTDRTRSSSRARFKLIWPISSDTGIYCNVFSYSRIIRFSRDWIGTLIEEVKALSVVRSAFYEVLRISLIKEGLLSSFCQPSGMSKTRHLAIISFFNPLTFRRTLFESPSLMLKNELKRCFLFSSKLEHIIDFLLKKTDYEDVYDRVAQEMAIFT